MNIENIQLFHNELISCGLSISGCDSSGNIHFLEPDTNNIAPLVLAAHGLPLSSDECLALQAALTEEQWLVYQDTRKAPIRAMRAERYRQEADPLILSSIESALAASTPVDGAYNITIPEASIQTWLEAKNSVRENYPYSE